MASVSVSVPVHPFQDRGLSATALRTLVVGMSGGSRSWTPEELAEVVPNDAFTIRRVMPALEARGLVLRTAAISPHDNRPMTAWVFISC